jgi:hypothetical protein
MATFQAETISTDNVHDPRSFFKSPTVNCPAR